MGDMIVEKLLLAVGLDAKDLSKDINNVVKSAAQDLKDAFTAEIPPVLSQGAASAFALIGLALVNFTKTTYDEIIALDKLSEKLGTSVDHIQAWQEATKDAGVATGEIGKVWEHLNSQIFEAVTKGRGALAQFIKQGILPELETVDGQIKDTETYMLELADAFSQMDARTANLVGKKIGIADSEMLEFFREGSGSINQKLDHIKQLGVYTKEDVKIAKDFDKALKELKKSLNDLGREVKTALMPVFRLFVVGARQMANGLKFLTEHARIFYPALFGIAVILSKSIIPLIAGLSDLIFGIVTKNPKLLAIMTILAAIGLIFEDIMVWMEGGESVIGDLLGDFETFSASMEETFGHIKELPQAIMEAFAFFPKALGSLAEEFFKLFGKDGQVAKSFDEMCERMKESFWDFIKSVKEWISDAFDFSGKIKGIEANASNLAKKYIDNSGNDYSTHSTESVDNHPVYNINVGSVGEAKQLMGGMGTARFDGGYGGTP